MKVNLPQNAWNGDQPVEINLPDQWKIEQYKMAADTKIPFTREGIRSRLLAPIGTDPIQNLVKTKTEVAIVFDDLSRPTPIQTIAELILEELLSNGISKKSIRFICALGSHGAMSRSDFEKKLGKNILKEYGVFNHNPYENCQKIGETSRGTILSVNSEFLSCDLKIGIGNISPHPVNGFGGGGKIIFPGLSAMDTIVQLHEAAAKHASEIGLDFVNGVGHFENQGMRMEIEEGVKMVGLDFIVDVIVNGNREIIDVFAGDPIQAYYEGAKESMRLHSVPGKPTEKDIVIVNANAKANEAAIALMMADYILKKDGDIVLINHCQRGQVIHYMGSAFGYQIGGRKWPRYRKRYLNANKIIYYTPFPDISSAMSFGDPDQITFAETWDEVLEYLIKHQENIEVGIITDGTMQYYA